ncbi:MAG TPA: hypothetical protein VGB84_01265 [Arachidicoccus sp.]
MKHLFFLAFFLGIAILGFSQTDTSLSVYTGKYTFPDGNSVSDAAVSIEGGQLKISSSVGSTLLSRSSKDTFTMVEYEGSVSFTRDSISHKIIKAHVKVASAEIDAEGDKQDIDSEGKKEEMPKQNNLGYRNPSEYKQ